MVGHFFDAEVRHVGHEHPELRCTGDGDIVDSDSVACDDQAPRRGVESLAGHAPPVRQDRIDIGGKCDQLIGFANTLSRISGQVPDTV